MNWSNDFIFGNNKDKNGDKTNITTAITEMIEKGIENIDLSSDDIKTEYISPKIQQLLKSFIDVWESEKANSDYKLTKPNLLGFSNEGLSTEGDAKGWGEKGLIQDMKNAMESVMDGLNKDSSNWKLNAPTPDKTSWETFGQTIGEYISDGIDKGVEIGLARQAEDSINIPEGEGSAGSMSSTATSSGSIPTGAAMYFHSPYDKINGHVGIYGGDGYIYHLGKGVKKNTLSELESKGYVYRGWGWSGGKDQSAQGNKIAEEAKKMSSYGYQSGSCQRWVSKVYQEALGGDRYQYTRPSAKIAGDEWIIGHSREGSSGISINQNTAIGRLISKKANEHNLLQGLYLDDVGYISAKYEGGKVGAIATVKGDHGGTSYGIPMFATNTGSADAFISWLKETYPNIGSYFSSHKAGTSYFNEAWKKASNDFPDIFAQAQIQYGIANIVEPQYKKILNKYGLDMKRNPALYEALISMAYQYNNLSSGLLNGYKPDMTDREIIELIYNNKANNIGNNFQSSSKAVQRGIANRIKNEYRDVLSLLSYEKGTSYHKGGKALLGDENLLKGSNKPSPEALIYPNGKVEIVGEDGPVIKDIPVGTQVLTTSQTKSLFNNISSYAEGASINKEDIKEAVKEAVKEGTEEGIASSEEIAEIRQKAQDLIDTVSKPFEEQAKKIQVDKLNKDLYKKPIIELYEYMDDTTTDYVERIQNKAMLAMYKKEGDLDTLYQEAKLYKDQQQALLDEYHDAVNRGESTEFLSKLKDSILELDDAIKSVDSEIQSWVDEMISYSTQALEAFRAKINHEQEMLDFDYNLGVIGKKTDENYYNVRSENREELKRQSEKHIDSVVNTIVRQALSEGASVEAAYNKAYNSEEYRNAIKEYYQLIEAEKQDREDKLASYREEIKNRETLLDLSREERWNNFDNIVVYYTEKEEAMNNELIALKESLKWENLSHEEYVQKTMEIADLERKIADNVKARLEAMQEYYSRQYESITYMVNEYTDALNSEKEAISETYDEEIRKLQTVNEQKERSIKLTELQTALDNAKKEKKRVYRAGVGFVYEENREEINKAEKELEDFYSQDRIDSMNEAKELELKALDERIEGWNKYLEAMEKVYKTAERRDHMKVLEGLYGVEGWEGIWKILNDDSNEFLINKEAGQDIYYGQNTNLLENYIGVSSEIYKKMDEGVQLLKDISQYEESNVKLQGVPNWQDFAHIITDFSATAADSTKIQQINEEYGLDLTTQDVKTMGSGKYNDLYVMMEELFKSKGPEEAMKAIKLILETGWIDKSSPLGDLTYGSYQEAWNIGMDMLLKNNPQLHELFNKPITINLENLGKSLGIYLGEGFSNHLVEDGVVKKDSIAFKKLKDNNMSDEDIYNLSMQDIINTKAKEAIENKTDIGSKILTKFDGTRDKYEGLTKDIWEKIKVRKAEMLYESGSITAEQLNEYNKGVSINNRPKEISVDEKTKEGTSETNTDVVQPEDMKEAVKEGTKEGIKEAFNLADSIAEYNEYNSNPSLADVDSNTINKMSVVNDGSGIMPVNNPDKENILTIGGNSVYNDNSTKYYFAQKPSVDIAGAINNATTKSDPMGVVNA